jgi:hypothetical protein
MPATPMLPIGYMAKRVSPRPEWLTASQVADVYSVSNCISKNFADYVPFWAHNGFWFFDSPQIIQRLARDHALDLTHTRLFYYEAYPLEFDADQQQWVSFEPAAIATHVVAPAAKTLAGYDIVTFSLGNGPECSPLSCNGLAGEVETNAHCLLASLEQGQRLLDAGQQQGMEPGPYRILAVYSVDWENDPGK